MGTSDRLIVGIDLGTSTSLLARWQGDHAEVWSMGQTSGSAVMRSVVWFDPEHPEDPDKVQVGEVAHRRASANPANALYTIKQSMGQDVTLSAAGRAWRPAEAASHLLRVMREKIERDTQLPIHLAVIATPYAFNHKQNLDTREAARLAGFRDEAVHLIPEPTAAALAFGLALKIEPGHKERMFVFDLGGGTFDITVYQVACEADALRMTVLTTGGLARIGGVTFDQELRTWALARFHESEGIALEDVDDRERIYATRQLLNAVEEAKHDLTTAAETELSVPNFLGGRHLDLPINRQVFGEMLAPHLAAIRDAVESCLLRCDLRPAAIDRVLLVGGASSVPAVRSLVREIFGKEPSAPKNPQQAVVEGAALYAGMRAGALRGLPKLQFADVVSYPIGVEHGHGQMDFLIDRDARLPAVSPRRIFSVQNPERPSITIKVRQGNSAVATRNVLIGRIVEPAVTRAANGRAQVELQLTVSEENVVAYTLRDLQSEQVRTGMLRMEGAEGRADAEHS